jgi:putative membrane protein insertion efficiency factor
MNGLAEILLALPVLTAKACIRFYQRTLSPDHGPFRFLWPYGACKFHPTCSEYALEAIDKHGLVVGLALGTRRLFRCTPFADGGHDPVPAPRRRKK